MAYGFWFSKTSRRNAANQAFWYSAAATVDSNCFSAIMCPASERSPECAGGTRGSVSGTHPRAPGSAVYLAAREFAQGVDNPNRGYRLQAADKKPLLRLLPRQTKTRRQRGLAGSGLAGSTFERWPEPGCPPRGSLR